MSIVTENQSIMAFLSKKQTKTKLHVISNGKDNRKVLGEVLRQSSKTKYSQETSHSTIDYKLTCSCQEHYNKQLLEQTYHITSDKLFDLLFGSNEFVRTYRQAQQFYDETVTEWMINESTSQQERTLRYKVPYQSTFIGKGTICTREKQIIFEQIPGSHYILETEVYNEGVKFSDTFSLIIRYCLVQTSLTTTHLRVTAQIIYNKSVNGFIKQIIERNAYSASQEGLKDLNNRLHLISNSPIERSHTSTTITESISLTPTIEHIIPTTCSSSPIETDQTSDSEKLIHILIFLIIILFFIHIYLYIQLKNTAILLDRIVYLFEN